MENDQASAFNEENKNYQSYSETVYLELSDTILSDS